MAPIKEVTDVSNSTKQKENSQPKENLWVSILRDVQSRGSNKLPSCKQIVVLGDNETGKTTLIAKLQGVEDPKKGTGLEYAYIDVRDEYRDDHTRLGVWVLDGDPQHSDLLQFALSKETYQHTMVMFTVSMTTPWGILDQLQSWATVLQDHIDKLNLSADEVQEYKLKYVKRWQDYIEPGDEMEQSANLKRASRNMEDESEDIVRPLHDILTRNLGLDVIVVVTKTDYMSILEKEYDYREEHFDFMQQWIRKFCLQYGAALFYTSVKEDRNCDLLYKYLVHRIYTFPFRTPALVVEKDAVFIPSGWDNESKISILYESIHSMKPDDYYTDVIAKPAMTRKVAARETETVCESEQTFLLRQQQLLQQGTPLTSSSVIRQDSTPLRTPVGVQKTSDRRSSSSPSVQAQLDVTKGGQTATSESVLANFFSSLLSKKTGAGGVTPESSPVLNKPLDKSTMRLDAAAELERLTRNKKIAANANAEQNNASSEC